MRNTWKATLVSVSLLIFGCAGKTVTPETIVYVDRPVVIKKDGLCACTSNQTMSALIPDRHRGDWMMTYTGKRFYPCDPRPEDFDIVDIAKGLSNQARFNGHTTEFYSVAQHSVLCFQVAEPEFKLDALLHDRTEAYISDIVRPAKVHLPDYQVMENRLEEVSAMRFDVAHPMLSQVKLIDNRMLVTEASQLLPPNNEQWWKDAHWPKPYDLIIVPMSPKEAFNAFLSAYHAAIDARYATHAHQNVL